MLEKRTPQIDRLERSEDGCYAKYSFQPLERGYGTTLGNALRRVLLSSLPGAAVTALRVEGVHHEFSTIPGVIEDMTELILNVKSIRARVHIDGPKTVHLKADRGTEGPLTAGDIIHDDELEIKNPDLVLCHLNGDSDVDISLTFAQGVGYNSAEENKWPHQSQTLQVIPIDSIFNPVRKVNYLVENTRVGQVTDFDRLILEIQTDGTINCTDALRDAAINLTEHLKPFTRLDDEGFDEEEEEIPEEEEENKVLKMLIEELDFSVRTFNCLKRAGINNVADLISKTEEDLMKVRNLGKKSLEEIILKLDELGITLPKSSEE